MKRTKARPMARKGFSGTEKLNDNCYQNRTRKASCNQLISHISGGH